MSSRQIHSIVAAGLADPRLLARWAADPNALLSLGIAPEELDVGALCKFAGLTTIVRHNGLRQDLPRTFRLLSTARMEIGLFADYAVHLAEAARRLAPDSATRAAELADFIGCWIDPAQPAHLLVHDMARHEVAMLWLGGDAIVLPPPPDRACTTARAETIPAARGAIRLHHFHSDPRSTELEMMPDGLMLGYWRASAAEPLQIVELDAFSYELLRLTDGARSAATLALAITGAAPTCRFFAALEEIAAIGIITLVAP